MTSDTRSPEEIEREIERERSALTHTLDDLQERFSFDGIARQVSDQFREHGGEISRSVTEAVKRNPVALALTGVGLAWLMLGNPSRDRYAQGRRYDPADHDIAPDYSRAGPAAGRTPSAQTQSRPLGSAASDPASQYRSRYARPADLPSWARATGPEGSTHSAHDDTSARTGGRMSGAASSAADTARKAGSRVSEGVKSATGAVSQAGRSTLEGAQNLASSASHRAAAFRERLAEGTENLSEEARNRVLAARERAVEARNAAMTYGRRGRERAADLFEEQPLVAGALAVAVGAAIGAALPRSRAEDHYLGEYSDSLMEEAERIYEEEKSKLSRVAKAATDEAGKIAEETKKAADDAAPADKNAAQAVADKAKSSGQRIADAASSEAKRQNVGDIKKS